MMKKVLFAFVKALPYVLAVSLLVAYLPDDEDHFVTAEATEIQITEETGESVDVNKLHDALYEMYGLEIYSARTDIPLYFQTNYEDVAFAGGTIASSGCGITCLSMIVDYLLDETILPDEMAERYSCGSNAAAAMESGIRSLGLNCKKYYGDAMYQPLREAAKNGHPVIILMHPGSEFTLTGHFMVVAGMTEDGKYIINDPNRENYDKPSLKAGYKYGFSEREIFRALAGVYIFDKIETEDARESVLSVYREVLQSYIK